jgi:nicotinamidase/pyrazinamidase
VVLTQDWHPADHISFAENHAGKHAFETIQLDYGTQVLWPSHCVQGNHDAELHPNLNIPHAQLIIRKGWHTKIDSYSAFLEADQTTTGLAGYLRSWNYHSICRWNRDGFLRGMDCDGCRETGF